MGKSFAPLLVVALLGAAGCGNAKEDAPPAKPPPKKPVDKSTWKEIETPVPVGKKLACAGLLPAEKVEAKLGHKVEVIDDSRTDPDATSVCRLVALDKKGKPAEEVCMITIGCWAQYTVAEIKKKCDARGDQTSTDIGAFTCVQTVPAGTKERHVVTVLEPDTRCRVTVNAGPYTYDVSQTRACAQAVVDLVDRDSLKQ